MDYAIFPPEEIVDTTVSLPLSKSISARALIMSRLSDNPGQLPTLADCDDTRALTSALTTTTGTIDIGAAGTAMRFATAYFAATAGTEVIIKGTERMHHRPIKVLVEALRSLGADIQYLGQEGFPPLKIHGHQLSGGSIDIDASVSSQFLSALVMVAPTMQSPLTINLNGEPTSLPYLKLTLSMMTAHGIDAELSGLTITVNPGPYSNFKLDTIEPDWSAASYWYSIAALSAGWVTLPDLNPDSRQGDSAMAYYGERLGVITSPIDPDEHPDTDNGVQLSASPEIFNRLEADMSATPDLVPTLAVLSPMLGVPFRFTGVHTLRDKETDRLQAICDQMRHLGFILETEGDDVLLWESKRCPVYELPAIDTYDDHRMAMAFAPVSLYLPGLVVRDVEVVAKSYPSFWEDLRAAGFSLIDTNDLDKNEIDNNPQTP